MNTIQKILENILAYFIYVLSPHKDNKLNWKDFVHREFKTVFFMLFLCFIIGIIFSGIFSIIIAKFIHTNDNSIRPTIYAEKFQTISMNSIQKNIMNRNIFNLKGEIPYEDTPEGNENFALKNFETAPCVRSEKLPVPLIGIIFTNNANTNIVSLKDPDVPFADVYKEGDALIDNPGYILYKVTGPTTAVFRHGRNKVCVALDLNTEQEGLAPNLDIAAVSISTAYVQEQLGSGFSKILTSARLVPQIIDGKTQGFKLFAIAKGSLFDKIQLINGDVVKSVNGIDLQDPSQGFKLYQAFQDENNITIQVERNGETSTKKVIVQ